MNIANIRSELKTVLTNLVTSTQVAVVYDYYEPNVSGYPAIIFDISSNTDAFLTNNENLNKIVFTAYVMTDIKVSGIEDSKDMLDTITDSAMTLLRSKTNMALDGEVDWISPVVGPRSQIDTPNGQVFAQQFDITVNVSSSVNP